MHGEGEILFCRGTVSGDIELVLALSEGVQCAEMQSRVLN